MKTKATSLNIKIKKGIIPFFLYFTVNKYKENKDKILLQIQKKFKNVAIRSSSFYEDQKGNSNAGRFKSFLNVKTDNIEILKNKINEVINSYKNFEHPKNQILIKKWWKMLNFQV